MVQKVKKSVDLTDEDVRKSNVDHLYTRIYILKNS